MATKTDDNHLHSANPPDYARKLILFQWSASIAAAGIFLWFEADKDYEILEFVPVPESISSGTMTADLKVAGTTVLTTKPTATVARTPAVATVFATTRIAEGEAVQCELAAGSATVGGIQGHMVLRPLVGKERVV